MSIFAGIIAVSIAVLLSFSDKIIKYFFPNCDFSKMEKETDKIILNIEEEDYIHHI